MAFFSKVGNILRQTASKQISADLSASRPSIYQAIRCMSSSKVFIGGLSYATDDQSLREAFGKYGEVTEARVIMDRETGKSRGFGFVSYTSSEEASSAIQALDGQELHGRRVRVNYAVQRSGPPPSQYGYPGAYNTGGGNYGSGYGAPGGNYGGNAGYGGGNYSGSGGGQGSGGNYGSNYGGDSYGNGGGGNYGGSNVSYGSAGNYAGGNTYDGGNSGAYGSSSGNYGVAGGIGGSDNHVSSGPAGGYDGSTGLGYGSGDQLGSNESGSMGDPAEGNYRDDDDDTNDFAKRA